MFLCRTVAPVLAFTAVWLGGTSPVHAAAPISFARDVIPALTKSGCNQGACHGTPTGKGGFRLSLRGYDPAFDYLTLTREMNGRRINRFEPNNSLLLLKATSQAAHEGGRRFGPEEAAHRLLADWIAQGYANDLAAAPPPIKLEIHPARALLDSPRDSETLRVIATFPDGTSRDVTHLAKFSVNDDAVAAVLPSGLVQKRKAGEVAVAAEYMGGMISSLLLFRDAAPGFRWPAPPEANYVDTHAFAKHKLLRIEPSPLSTDEEFLRRAHLDATGRVPTPEEVRAFLADSRPNKREKVIDDLLARPEFADWWGMKWADRLGMNQRFVGIIGAVKYHQWVRGQIAANVPEDEFARAVLTGKGPNYAEPAAGFYRRLRDPATRSEEIAQLFMGVRMGCAKCHNHPGEKWTQNDYYGLAAFFARIAYRNGPYFVHIYDKEETVLTVREGEVTHPRSGAVMRPRFLGGAEAALADRDDRRVAFAEWLTAPSNPFFAKATVNRIWFHLFSRGIVEPVDDFRSTNPACNEELLTALAEDFVRHGFDRKHTIRTIMNSRTYQLSHRKTATNAEDVKYFSRYVPHRLPAEALLDAISDATGVPESFAGFPAGTSAARLPDGEFKHPFLVSFGRPARAMACECERETDSSLGQALQLVGGLGFQEKLRNPKGRVAKSLAVNLSNEAITEELFLATLGRMPSGAERAFAAKQLADRKGPERQQAVEDLLHALLNHAEFLFQR